FSPDFHDAKHLPFLIMILGTLILPPISKCKLRPREVLLLIVMTYAGMRSVRHIPIYVLIAVPALCGWLEGALPVKWMRSSEENALNTPKIAVNGGLLLFFIAFMVVRLTTVVKNQSLAEAEKYPAKAVDFIRAHSVPQPLLNHYNWGGYVIWKL